MPGLGADLLSKFRKDKEAKSLAADATAEVLFTWHVAIHFRHFLAVFNCFEQRNLASKILFYFIIFRSVTFA